MINVNFSFIFLHANYQKMLKAAAQKNRLQIYGGGIMPNALSNLHY